MRRWRKKKIELQHIMLHCVYLHLWNKLKNNKYHTVGTIPKSYI